MPDGVLRTASGGNQWREGLLAKVMGPMLVHALDATEAPLLMRPYFAGGDPGPITATMANVPELTEAAMPFLGAALGASAVDFRTKEIVIVRTSALLGCRYCIDSHTTVALDAGLTHDQVEALRDPDNIPGADLFPSSREQALLLWNDAVALGRGPIDNAANEAIKANFADHEIVEITVLIGTTMLLNRYATALQLPVGPSTIERLAQEGF
jgi:AhpD family alkylhydroperoxidase